ncbi:MULTISPECIES: hypothetical protein [unclassified Halomonas]|uniref:hypothetical protein n=1 Tax=unclassified Halomonas TaxID=2609666 RepID=UPI00099041F8|nr:MULTISPECIES: hypothetical protein [unclassified Halomonas]AQU82653.1 hypothetical protein B2G49_08580 [Halomonas sp. 'Soap Lake \
MSWNTLLEEMDLETVPFSDNTLSYLDKRNIDVGEPQVGSVDLSKVVGTTHPDYCDKTWGELKPIPGTSEGDFINNRDVAFQGLKRAVVNIQSLERNPDYYFSDEEKEHWSFYQIGDEYYISTGNNRTVIGRLFLHLNEQEEVVHGVRVTPAEFKKEPEVESEHLGLISRLMAWFRT